MPQQNLALLLPTFQVWQTLNKAIKLINPSSLINFVASLVLKCNQITKLHPNHDLKTNFCCMDPMWIHLQNQIENFSYVNLFILSLLALGAQWASRFFLNKHSWGGHSLYILKDTSNYRVFKSLLWNNNILKINFMYIFKYIMYILIIFL